MSYYRLQFQAAPAEEGERFEYKTHEPCSQCGFRFIEYSRDFQVPEDRVRRFHLELWDELEEPLFLGADLLVARTDFAEEMVKAGLTGYRLEEARVTLRDRPKVVLPSYQWVIITGRCRTNDVWRRVVSTCPQCHGTFTEPVKSPVRNAYLRLPLPEHDLSRARERLVGIVVSQRFKDFLTGVCPEYERFVELKEISLEPQQGK